MHLVFDFKEGDESAVIEPKTSPLIMIVIYYLNDKSVVMLKKKLPLILYTIPTNPRHRISLLKGLFVVW